MSKLLCIVLLSSMAVAQATAPAQKKPAQTPASKTATTPQSAAPAGDSKSAASSEVSPTTPVLTISGLCNGKLPATPSTDCKTVMTREEFEKMASALDPRMPAARRPQLATAYAQMLAASDLAEQRGLQNAPEGQRFLQLMRMQAMAALLARDVQKEAANIPEAEVEKYYNEHAAQYEEASFQRIFIPKTPPGGEKPADEKTLEAEGQKIRALAAAPNADFEKLQKQAYDDLGLKTPPPTTSAESMRRSAVAPTQAKVFDLEPGKVSEVLNEAGGLYIFRLESKKKAPLSEVYSENHRTLEQERMRAEVEKITNLVKPELNTQYFGALPPAGPGAPPMAPPTRPPAAPARPPGR